jgi:dTMP kinase
MMKLKKGYLFVLEGIDGTGKSTHCKMLENWFYEKGIPVLRLREPTDGFWGQKIRVLLTEGRNGVSREEELEWFVNDRKEDVALNILPALKEKKVVVLDRYYFSTAAYQGALGLDPHRIIIENESFAPKPDRAFFLKTPIEECLRRIHSTRNSVSSFEKKDYLEKVQSLLNSFDDPIIRSIDNFRDIEEVHHQLRNEIMECFNEGEL